MDHFAGVTAEIISNGQAQNLYDDPDGAEVDESHARHHYVEAVAGSTFQVKVNLSSQFNFFKMKPEHAVAITVSINGKSYRARVIVYTKKRLLELFSRGKPGGHTFTSLKQFCPKTGQWMRSDYCFGNLVIKEAPASSLSVKQAQDLGKIQVTVQRITLEKLRNGYMSSTKPIAMINEVPEKALKGRPIDITISLANTRPASEPSVHTVAHKSIGGEAGKPLVFNIYYRSRHALQVLGCIPRSPLPEVKTPEHQATAPEDIIQEVRDLRARLALLERGLNVKSEPSSAAPRVKREREEEDNEGARQRRRTSVKIEHVDLTDD